MKNILLLFLPLCFLWCADSYAQTDAVTHLSESSNRDGYGFIILNQNWRYHPGDDMAWADPLFDDSDWEQHVFTTLSSEHLPESGWDGIGWFRLHLRVDEALRDVPLALLFEQSGAAEIYLNGRKIHNIGHVSKTRENEQLVVITEVPKLLGLSLKDKSEHLLAIRYSNSWSSSIFREGFPVGFELSVGPLQEAEEFSSARIRVWTVTQMLFFGLAFAFSLLHLLLYYFYPRIKANLFYAMFTGGVAIFIYLAFELAFIRAPSWFLSLVLVTKIALLLFMIFGLRFLYELYYPKPSIQFYLLTGGAVCIALGAVYINLGYVYLYSILILADMLRVTIVAISRKLEGAWIIGIGFLLFIGATIYQILISTNILSGFIGLFEVIFIYGLASLFLSMSVYLAWIFARINKGLEEYNQTLEDKVKVRTEALNASNVELREAMNQLAAAQSQIVMQAKMASLGDLVAGITHELNTPLGAINSLNDTLARAMKKLKTTLEPKFTGENDDQRRIKSIFQIVDSVNRDMSGGVERVTAVVNNLRNFVRLDEAEHQQVNIHETIDNTLNLLTSQLGDEITVVKEYDERMQPINCLPGQLSQLFMHLLKNAAQAIEVSGEIRIRTIQNSDSVSVRISDTGIGIEAEQLEKIFDFGFSSHDTRVKMGFGLPTSYQIVKEHQGEIRIASEPGKGTEVIVELVGFE